MPRSKEAVEEFKKQKNLKSGRRKKIVAKEAKKKESGRKDHKVENKAKIS